MAAAEAYSAMTTGHVYRRPREQCDALAELVGEAGAQFDPAVIGALQAVLSADHERLRDELSIDARFPDGLPPARA